MLSLSQTVGYAILALGCIGSWKGERVFTKQIHDCTGISLPYLRKILFNLAKSGLIDAKRGYQGGFRLSRLPEEITLLDVAKGLGKDGLLPECLLELPGCSESTPCPLHDFWQVERSRIEAKLSEITIDEAVDSVLQARGGKLTCRPCGPTKKVNPRICT